jgi:hypothetical protein
MGELNRVLADMSDRLDQMEGFRDNPKYRADVDLNQYRATNAGSPTNPTDLVRRDEIYELAYPVGSLFFSTVSTNPAALLGFGTWETFATGKVLIGVDPDDADFGPGDTGGAKTHEHSTPDHQHPDGEEVDNDGLLSTVLVNDANGGGGMTGSGSSMPPYICVYIWHRTE